MNSYLSESESVHNKKKGRHFKKSIPTFLFKTYKILMVCNFFHIFFLQTSSEYLMISRTLFLNFSYIPKYPYITRKTLYFIRIPPIGKS